MKWLLLFVPTAIVLSYVLPDNPGLVFAAAVLAIIPLAGFLGEATEHLAFHTGESIGGLLNATFGNLAELLILVAVLRSGMFDIVLSGIYGAILVNALLATGLAMLFGGSKFHTQKFETENPYELATLLALAVFALAVISIIGHNPATTTQANAFTSNIVAVFLLIGYALYLVFSLVTHKDLFKTPHESSETAWPVKKALIRLIVITGLVVWISELLSGSVEQVMEIYSLNAAFVGAVVIAILGGAAEMAAAVRAARNNRMDLSLSITMGASVQIVLFVAPVLVLLSNFVAPRPFLLNFDGGGVILLFMAVVIVGTIARDGRATWFKGALLVLVYCLIATGIYLRPQH